MTRPEIVRADTLDLQDPVSPSAKDHTRQPASPRALGDGPPAPHQAQSLRRASLEGYDLHVRSPRGSKDFTNKELKLLQDQEMDDQDGAGDGGQGNIGEQDLVGQDMMDDDDDDLDDDMMDKISSSPSIDDGVYTLKPAWPRRTDSLLHRHSDRDTAGDSTISDGKVLPNLLYTDVPGLQHQLSEAHHHHRVRLAAIESIHESTNRRRKVAQRKSGEAETLGEPSGEVSEDESSSNSDGGGVEELKIGDLLLDPVFTPLAGDCRGDICDNGIAIDKKSDSSESSSDDDDDPEGIADEPDLWTDERFVDSGWGGECLREIEDIDFEFVYALHTFVATVEGQANATKGDTMVLLDDSNSYWWLVKVVKDSSIGYLPAEHIETPTERLARLNKHRNIDVGYISDDSEDSSDRMQLSQTMLGDNPEKTRNPLKIAMRRRNAKTVQFAEPTYWEPSEPEYSSDEEEDDLMSPLAQAQAQGQGQAQVQTQQHDSQPVEDETAVVEPLKMREKTSDRDEAAAARTQENGAAQINDSERPRSSQDTQDSRDDDGTGRKGVRIRNTDSFYKDDSVETRKISLTPGILRDEAPAAAAEESRASLDSQKSNEKPATNEKPKKEKKEKKGMLGNLFKRKNSKSKHEKEEERDDLSGTTISPQQSIDSVSHESTSSAATVTSSQNSKPGKLQKAQPTKSGSVSKRNQNQNQNQNQEEQAQKAGSTEASKSEPAKAREEAQEPVQETARQTKQDGPAPLTIVPSGGDDSAAAAETKSPATSKGGLFSPIQTVQTMLSSNSTSTDPRPAKVKKAKNRMALEDSDVSEDDAIQSQQALALDSTLRPSPYALATTAATTATTTTTTATKPNRLSESPIEVSPVVSSAHLVPGQSSASHLDVPPSPVSAVSTPELVERPLESEATRSGINNSNHSNSLAPQQSSSSFPKTTTTVLTSTPVPVATKTPDNAATPSTSTMSSPVTAPSTPQWSPSALRAYLESDGANDVRDLILLVHDTSSVKGLPQHHDMMKGFNGDRGKLEGMQKRLDGLLGEVLARRSTAPVGMI